MRPAISEWTPAVRSLTAPKDSWRAAHSWRRRSKLTADKLQALAELGLEGGV
ncbi:hypothetical protein [Streptomyces sp. NBC_01727]|uniref:hypothetical protein n=1 Tax=Streptomyces sp. NBC_01727 TaxID=2975924 RepID=UPI002E0F3E82|nr:hypothetical protein OIE76_44325 [Streptomyces sp. NBC_01727]